MFKAEDKERARKIVSELELPVQFGETNGVCDQIEEQLGKFLEENFYVTSGVSKLVIVVESLPFVIKIPFNGQWDEDWSGEEIGEVFMEFENASEYDCSDYCYAELEFTQAVIDSGFGVLVPHMEYLCEVDGRSVYIQEKVIPVSEARASTSLRPSEKSLKKAEKDYSPFWGTWLAQVYDVYGDNFWHMFVRWAEEWQPEILQDVHSGNYGIYPDGRPVMFDISGFRN